MGNKYKKGHGILLGIAILALSLSFFVEYIMHIPPCSLCKLQRIPYFIVATLATLSFFLPYKKILLRLIQICFLGGMILAVYHTCAEFKLLTCSCQATPPWTIFGLPPPFYNGLFSLTLLIGIEIFLFRINHRNN